MYPSCVKIEAQEQVVVGSCDKFLLIVQREQVLSEGFYKSSEIVGSLSHARPVFQKLSWTETCVTRKVTSG